MCGEVRHPSPYTLSPYTPSLYTPWVRSHLHPSQQHQCKPVQGTTWMRCLHPECSSRTPTPSRGIQTPKGLPCDHRRPILPHLVSQSQPFGLIAVATDLKGFKTPLRHGLGGFLPLTQSGAVRRIPAPAGPSRWQGAGFSRGKGTARPSITPGACAVGTAPDPPSFTI